MSKRFSAWRTSTLTLCKFSTTSGFSSAFWNSSRLTSPLPSSSASSKICTIFTRASCSFARLAEASSSVLFDACVSVFWTMIATTTWRIEKLVAERNTMKNSAVHGITLKAGRAIVIQPSTDITWNNEYMLVGTSEKYWCSSEPAWLALPIQLVEKTAAMYNIMKQSSHAQTNVRAAETMPSTRNHNSLKKRSSRKILPKRASRKHLNTMSKSTLPAPPTIILKTSVSAMEVATRNASKPFHRS
mmetsp:Transcript_8408/g.24028  ORF Transcript_8408/g.24028 Transcript_8408/m.24028 type:complete len:244 (-) Transcript_8408:578-1309(-)